MSLIGLVMVLTGVVVTASSLPLWLEKVPPNRFYGFRTPRTVNDPEVWYPINRMTGRDLAIGGAVGTVAVVAGDLLLVDPVQSAVVLTTLMTVPILLAVVRGFWTASAFLADHDAKVAKGETTGEASKARRPLPKKESER